MVNDDAPAKDRFECLNQCNIEPDCLFWDLGGGFCRLRSNDGNGPEPIYGGAWGWYYGGPKHCATNGEFC